MREGGKKHLRKNIFQPISGLVNVHKKSGKGNEGGETKKYILFLLMMVTKTKQMQNT